MVIFLTESKSNFIVMKVSSPHHKKTKKYTKSFMIKVSQAKKKIEIHKRNTIIFSLGKKN